MRPISSGFRTALAWLAMLAVPALALAFTGHIAHAQHLLNVSPLLIGATNTLGNYNETFFAQQALIILEKALGMANRVYRQYDPSPSTRGSTINIRRPSTFTAQAAPSSDQNVSTDSLSITVDQWPEVKFSITDKDLTQSAAVVINDHIAPAAYALADDVDQKLAALYKSVPWYTTMSATPALADITAVKKLMRDNKVPLGNNSQLHFMIGSAEEAAFLNATTTLSNPAGGTSLRDGSLGNFYGFDTFPNQNTPVSSATVMTDFTGALGADTAVGDTTINISSIDSSGVVHVGDIVTITGDPQQYVVATQATASSGAIAALAISPNIKKINTSSTVVTINQGGGASKNQNLAFHTNAFALAFAAIDDLGKSFGGVKMEQVADPVTGLSVRARLWYDADNSRVKVALDCLYGVKCLDPNLAVRALAH